MFESLSDRLTGALKDLRGKGRLSPADIDATAAYFGDRVGFVAGGVTWDNVELGDV